MWYFRRFRGGVKRVRGREKIRSRYHGYGLWITGWMIMKGMFELSSTSSYSWAEYCGVSFPSGVISQRAMSRAYLMWDVGTVRVEMMHLALASALDQVHRYESNVANYPQCAGFKSFKL